MASIHSWAASSTLRYPRASAATPAGMLKNRNGRLVMVCTMLTSTGLSVSEVITQDTPSSSITRPSA